MKHNLFKGASSVLGAIAIAFAAPAFAFAQVPPAAGETQAIDATALAGIVQAAIDALPEDATEEQIEAAIAAAVAGTGADAATVAQAMVIVATNNATNPSIVIAATNVATNPPSQTPGGVTAGGAPAGDGAGSPPPAGGGAGGGTSDY
ncbi:hypothetical protein [Oceanicaulis sp.]|uniref:hypothetical protein n=1 Tax=Oceanicaulis sp. TaxID=1924941 RepID=UPI003BA866F8